MLILKKIAAHINYVFSLFHVKLELHTTKIAVCSNLSNLGEKNVELHMHSIPDFIESAHMKIHV